MADFGILIAGKLVEVIGSEVIKEICTLWGYESQLEELKETVTAIQKVLIDAEAIRELSNEQQHYISKLKDAVYDADDLFDEFRTLAELNQLEPHTRRGKYYEKVRQFFSSKNKVNLAYRMSRDVKDIKKRLDGIADNYQKYGFSVDYKPISKRREETCSYVDANDIIGRDNDKEAIVDMLLNPNNNTNGEDFFAVTIVGVGGLGKTAIAQLVYNDERIKKEFPESRFWVCVSDQDGELFDVKTILCKILEVVGVGDRKVDGSSPMELVQQQFQETLRGKKYLLVLDDVWSEDREKWLNLKKFLILGQIGSRVVVTTRSKRTGTIIGEKHAYELEGLSQDDSWLLFEKSAFDKTDKPENYHEFAEVGKKIAVKCYNIPLALKVVGSLLFGQDISQWRSFEDAPLAHNEILSILKLSYYNLAPSFKYCFGYCAVFPKDYRFKKQNLIDLWMAQGYITPLNKGQSVEDAAEEHFVILLRRCFFQDVEKDEYGEILFVKIHDLMHDVAQEMGREEFCVVTSLENTVEDKIRHVSYDGDTSLIRPLGSSKLRSFICQSKIRESCVVTQVDNWIRLRVLDLSALVPSRFKGEDVKKLPRSIGKLLHLRYLNLSYNYDLEVLPNEITRLHNLQTLLLCRCYRLRELPEDFSKLVNLRHLDLSGCLQLPCMPSGMGKMTSLKVLPYYYVGKSGGRDGLKVLKALTGIRGCMEIEIGENYKEEGMDEREGLGDGYLKGMKHLTKIEIKFEGICGYYSDVVLENLEPPSNVKELKIYNYIGKTIPKWGRAMDDWAFSLTHLVQIFLENCHKLEEMPVLSRLPLLKSLRLASLYNLEYVEMDIARSSDGGTKLLELDRVFFPSLVTLKIFNLERLKGWWKKSSGVDDDLSYCSYRILTLPFPRLCEMVICNCPNLASILPCPRIEMLHLKGNHGLLQVIVKTTEPMDENMAGNSQDLKLQVLITDNMHLLKSLPVNRLTYLDISLNQEVGEVDSSVSEVLASSLRTLKVGRMNTLRILCGETRLENFTALEELSLGINNFQSSFHFVDEEKENEFETCFFPPNLHSLEFLCLFKMKSLPKGMQSLSFLKSLSISRCPALKSLPQAMNKLTSLQSLKIYDCPELGERCKEPDGEDRPKIQHIPNISIIHKIRWVNDL